MGISMWYLGEATYDACALFVVFFTIPEKSHIPLLFQRTVVLSNAVFLAVHTRLSDEQVA